eukprot:3932306-Rhodomonas_salina.1
MAWNPTPEEVMLESDIVSHARRQDSELTWRCIGFEPAELVALSAASVQFKLRVPCSLSGLTPPDALSALALHIDSVGGYRAFTSICNALQIDGGCSGGADSLSSPHVAC